MSIPVESQDFSENENEDHADKDAGLLHVGADTSVADNTDTVAGRKTCQANCQAARKVHEATGPVSACIVDQAVI